MFHVKHSGGLTCRLILDGLGPYHRPGPPK